MRSIFSLVTLLLLVTFSQAQDVEMDQLITMMTGSFDSSEQAAADTNYYDISLIMAPIWEGDKEAKWLYVEQALNSKPEKPYRQRLYRVVRVDADNFESRVYTLPDPERFIQPWETMDIFDTITPDSLEIRKGCAVYLTLEGHCFSGSTNAKDCESTMRGATYATSEVTICDDEISSWDRGWNDDEEHMWGAEFGAYVFKRLEEK